MKKLFSLIILILICVPCRKARALAETAESACLMNAVTGNVIFEKNADECLPMASTTKIVTLLTALELSEPEEIAVVPKEAVAAEGSSAYLKSGAKITMENLMYGLMLNSGNDAAVAIAYHVSGGTAEFAEKMNAVAKKAGVENTNFKNPNGLDEDGHYTTARDLAKITRYALKNEEFCRIVSARTHKAEYTQSDGTVFELEYINHNRLLKEYEGCIGVKTGYTKADGRCLVSAAQRDGAVYIAVTLNCPNDWTEHTEMLNSAFEACHIERVISKGDTVKQAKSGNRTCDLIAAENFEIPIDGETGSETEIYINLPREINFSLNKGEKVGELSVILNGGFIGKVDIEAKEDFYVNEKASIKPSFGFTVLTLLRILL